MVLVAPQYRLSAGRPKCLYAGVKVQLDCKSVVNAVSQFTSGPWTALKFLDCHFWQESAPSLGVIISKFYFMYF